MERAWRRLEGINPLWAAGARDGGSGGGGWNVCQAPCMPSLALAACVCLSSVVEGSRRPCGRPLPLVSTDTGRRGGLILPKARVEVRVDAGGTGVSAASGPPGAGRGRRGDGERGNSAGPWWAVCGLSCVCQ